MRGQPFSPSISTLQDEALARRMDQELSDHQYAQTLQHHEQNNNTSPVSQSNITNLPTPYQGFVVQQQVLEKLFQRRLRRRRKRFFTISIITLIIMGCIVAGVLYFGNFFGNSQYISVYTDPWNSRITDGTLERWQTVGLLGLKLTIQNALTDDWHPFFQKAVDDWNLAPALSLEMVNFTEADPSCTPVHGVLRVCNSDYGPTDWLGINESIIINNYIRSSVSKMNEHYLAQASQALRQFTMCHEIGHGFGLPHRDENFNNPDLGSCLDYTTRPQNNMHPNQADFDHLADLYLSSSRRRMLEPVESMSLFSMHGSYKHGRLLRKSKQSEVWETVISDQVRIRNNVLLA